MKTKALLQEYDAFVRVILLIGAKHVLRKVAKRNETFTGTDNNTFDTSYGFLQN
jgi:hypothetical protein